MALGTTEEGTVIETDASLDLNGQTYTNEEPLTLNGYGYSNNGALLNSNATSAVYNGLLTLGSACSIVGNVGQITINNPGIIMGSGEDLMLSGLAGGILISALDATIGSLTKQGTGIWEIDGDNSYTGKTDINAGTLKLGSSTALGDIIGETNINTDAILDLNGQYYTSEEPLSISGGTIINTGGSTLFSGPITLNSSTTITTNNQITLSGSISGNSNGIYSLTKLGSNSLVLANNTITVIDLNLIEGTLDGGTSTININGTFANSGNFNPSQSTVIFKGDELQIIPSADFYNATINNNMGTELAGDISIGGLLMLSKGILNTSNYSIDLGTTGTVDETNAEATEYSYVTGNVKCTRTLQKNAKNNFGGIGIELTDTVYDNNVTKITRTTGTACMSADGHHSIKRYFTIIPTIDSNLNGTMIFHYFNHEIIGHTEENLKIFKSTDNRITWGIQGNSIDVANNILTLQNISSFSDWTASDGINSFLPISLKSFDVNKKDNSVIIQWTTLTETNNDYFSLEQSEDNENWNTIYTCKGQGTSTTIHNYSFTDNNPSLGINYYRLKQTDIDGTYTYSKTKIIRTINNNISFQVFPLPAKADEIVILGSCNKKGKLILTIFDINGQKVYNKDIEQNNGNFSIKLKDFYIFNSGIYFVSIIQNDIISQKTIIIE